MNLVFVGQVYFVSGLQLLHQLRYSMLMTQDKNYCYYYIPLFWGSWCF